MDAATQLRSAGGGSLHPKVPSPRLQLPLELMTAPPAVPATGVNDNDGCGFLVMGGGRERGGKDQYPVFKY